MFVVCSTNKRSKNSPIELEDVRKHTNYGRLYDNAEATMTAFWNGRVLHFARSYVWCSDGTSGCRLIRPGTATRATINISLGNGPRFPWRISPGRRLSLSRRRRRKGRNGRRVLLIPWNVVLFDLPDFHIHENGLERLFDVYIKILSSLGKLFSLFLHDDVE